MRTLPPSRESLSLLFQAAGKQRLQELQGAGVASSESGSSRLEGAVLQDEYKQSMMNHYKHTVYVYMCIYV